jgi:hypothetical protein
LTFKWLSKQSIHNRAWTIYFFTDKHGQHVLEVTLNITLTRDHKQHICFNCAGPATAAVNLAACQLVALGHHNTCNTTLGQLPELPNNTRAYALPNATTTDKGLQEVIAGRGMKEVRWTAVDCLNIWHGLGICMF